MTKESDSQTESGLNNAVESGATQPDHQQEAPAANQQEPLADKEPSAEKEPSANGKPSANEEPSADKEPSGQSSEKGSTDTKESLANNSSSDETSSGEEGSELEKLQERVEELEAELAQTKEQVLRAHADAQNIRRRAEQDVEKAHKFGLEKFVNDILPVADNLERAIEASKAETANMQVVVEGVELTLKSLLDGLGRHKVEQIHPEGEPFDPQLHQAMTMVEQSDVEPNTVVNVFQRGYTLHGRLVRPAMVVVSKAPTEDKANS